MEDILIEFINELEQKTASLNNKNSIIGPQSLIRRLRNTNLETEDEQLLLFKIVDIADKSEMIKEKLYDLLTEGKSLENIEMGIEIQPPRIRKDEGNTYLDLAMGAIKRREKTESGIELKEKISFVFCEAKWRSDISCDVTYCSIRNQLQRVIENALLFAGDNYEGEIHVTLITPELYKENYENGVFTRFYAHKFKEYKDDIKRVFMRELDAIEKIDTIPLISKEKSKEIISKNLEKLELHWVTFEDILKMIKESIECNEV